MSASFIKKNCIKAIWGLIPSLILVVVASADVNAQSKIYWTNFTTKSIQRANLDGTGIETVVFGVESLGVAVDSAGGQIYWTDLGSFTTVGDETIRRANLDGSGVQVLVVASAGLRNPTDIRLDVPGGKMYWTETGLAKIYRANLDGSAVEVLIDFFALRGPNYGGGPGQTFEFSNGWGLALDLAAGHMYWSDFFAGDIHRANLDGTGVSSALVSGLWTPRGITLDIADSRMYWTEASFDQTLSRIQRSDLDGSFAQVLQADPAGQVDEPFDIELDLAAGKFYWTDRALGLIQRADLDGANAETLVALRVWDAKHGRWEGNSLTAIDLYLEPPSVCSDGIDNDGDGLVDFPADPQCHSAADNRESVRRRCGLLGIEILLVMPLWAVVGGGAIAKRRSARG